MENGTDSAPQFLSEEFSRRVRSNPRYSLRAFARSLGMSAGALSEVMRGHRPLSLKSAARVVKSLGLGRAEADRLYCFVEDERRKEVAPGRESARRILDEDTFSLLAEWHHFAILNLMNCQGFKWQAAYIAKRLAITQAQADLSMKLLLRLGLVKRRSDGVEVADDFVLSPDGIPSSAVRAYHRAVLEKAIQALDLQSLNERDITGLGFAIDPAHMQLRGFFLHH